MKLPSLPPTPNFQFPVLKLAPAPKPRSLLVPTPNFQFPVSALIPKCLLLGIFPIENPSPSGI